MPVPSLSTTSFLKEAATQYRTDLLSESGSSALDWLAERMIDPEGTARRFVLGYVDNPLPGHEQYRGCIAIPYINAAGTVVKMRFRTLSVSASCKYLDMAGGKPLPYNLSAVTAYSPYMCISEGEFDAQSAEIAGMPCVGLPGAEAWRPEWRRFFMQYRTVYMLQDGDEAGERLAHTIAKDVPQLRAIPMGATKQDDVNKYLVDNGPEALREKVGV
ncbi:toprim domain-containing protein [Streptomyces sp. NPDC127112]|uniref:toprim domain-containing protein n=1 Tax=Streptomyces sp. NPDC127112 TaxID=3345364 RepID=UPI0036406DA5